MARYIYLMRHAETLFNVQGKTQGWCDSPLTERGVEQACLAGLEFARRGILFDHAYCSTAERTSDTLELACSAAFGRVMPYERLKGLRELNFGAYEGKDSFLERHDEGFGEFYVPFGGERHVDAAQRLTDTLTEIMERPGHESVLVVSHGGIAINFFEKWRRYATTSTMIFANCMTYVYEYTGAAFSCKDMFVADLSSLERPDLPQQVRIIELAEPARERPPRKEARS